LTSSSFYGIIDTIRETVHMELIDRFEEKIIFRVGECWPFIGCRGKTGYGRFNVSGASRLAHRIAWIIFVGDIPDNLHVLHKCDNPACCNPKHLFIGTHQDNMDDKIAKGHGSDNSLENNPRANLSLEEVAEIRRMLLIGFSQRFIANKFHVSRSAIAHIKAGNTWRQDV
jgi:hypothetical protein